MIFACVISTSPPFVRVELALDGNDAKAWFSLLENDSEAIEEEFGEELIWHSPPDIKGARVQTKNDLDFRNHSQREEAKEWIYERLRRFHEVLKPRALALNAADATLEVDEVGEPDS